MAGILADTHKAIVSLESKKFSSEQAEGIVDVVESIDLSHIATKEDLKDLRIDMYKAMIGQTVVILGVVIAMFQFLK